MDKMTEIGKRIALLMSLICLGIAAWFAGRSFYAGLKYWEGNRIYEEIGQMALAGDGEEPDEGETVIPYVNFLALQEINPQIVAWLYCPDTVINYPVTQGGGQRILPHTSCGRDQKQQRLSVH